MGGRLVAGAGRPDPLRGVHGGAPSDRRLACVHGFQGGAGRDLDRWLIDAIDGNRRKVMLR